MSSSRRPTCHGGLGAGALAWAADGIEDELLLFLADLGAALSAIGETVDAVEERLGLIARAYGLQEARFSVFPTSLFLTIARGEAATIEPTKRLSATPRLDQIAAVHRLAEEAERGALEPAEGSRSSRRSAPREAASGRCRASSGTRR